MEKNKVLFKQYSTNNLYETSNVEEKNSIITIAETKRVIINGIEISSSTPKVLYNDDKTYSMGIFRTLDKNYEWFNIGTNKNNEEDNTMLNNGGPYSLTIGNKVRMNKQLSFGIGSNLNSEGGNNYFFGNKLENLGTGSYNLLVGSTHLVNDKGAYNNIFGFNNTVYGNNFNMVFGTNIVIGDSTNTNRVQGNFIHNGSQNTPHIYPIFDISEPNKVKFEQGLFPMQLLGFKERLIGSYLSFTNPDTKKNEKLHIVSIDSITYYDNNEPAVGEWKSARTIICTLDKPFEFINDRRVYTHSNSHKMRFYMNTVQGSGNFVFGSSNVVAKNYSMATIMGFSNAVIPYDTSKKYSGGIIFGYRNTVYNDLGVAIGYACLSKNESEISMGVGNISYNNSYTSLFSIGTAKRKASDDIVSNKQKNAITIARKTTEINNDSSEDKLYLNGVGGYTGFETDLETVKSLQDIIRELQEEITNLKERVGQ